MQASQYRQRWLGWAVGAAGGSAIFMAWWLHWFDLVDLEVYRAGASAFLHGHDIYLARPRVIPLPFTYPPFASVVFAPLAIAPDLGARVAMSAASAAALLFSVLAVLRLAAPRWRSQARWTVALGVVAATPLIEPVRDTFRLGQVNLVLMALVLADLVAIATRAGTPPAEGTTLAAVAGTAASTGVARAGRWVPRGVLLGVATAVKLTPGIFILYLFAIRRRREAVTATVATGGATLLAAVLMPSASAHYWRHLVLDDRRIGSAGNVWNQSIRGALARLTGSPDRAHLVWIVLAVTVGGLGLALAARLHAGGEPVLGIGVTAVVGLLISPISWNHHWVWALPLAIGLWRRAVVIGGRANWWLAGGWTATFCLASMAWWPFAHQDDYHLVGLNAVAADGYILAAVIAAVVIAARQIPARSRPEKFLDLPS